MAGALTATWLGDEGLTPQQELTQLAAAALLRDLGMLHIDPVLLQPAVPLSREQRQQLCTRTHWSARCCSSATTRTHAR